MKSILVAVPVRPTLSPELQRLCREAAFAMVPANPELELTFCFDYRRIEFLPGDDRPWSKVARARNAILDTFKLYNRDSEFDSVFWVDADVVSYHPNLPSWLYNVNPDGVSAPMVFVERSETFYDWAAFILKDRSRIEPTNRLEILGRNMHGLYPYFPEPIADPLVAMDCVGTCMLVNTDIYRAGARYEDHLAFTDHFSICKKAWDMGRCVTVDQRVRAWHAYLPFYGEAWH